MKKTTTVQPASKVSLKSSDIASLMESIKQKEKLELQSLILKNKSKQQTKGSKKSKK